MFGKISNARPSRIRRARVDCFEAELDLAARVVSISWRRDGKAPMLLGDKAPMLLGEGVWTPLPPPMGDLRGKIMIDHVEPRTRALFEYQFGRGNRAWSYDDGPWITAQQTARAAGVADADTELLRKVLWLFYRNRWPLQFAVGCGWGADGYGPMIKDALARPGHMRARWELLILTGALQFPRADGNLDDVDGELLRDDFYASP
jgi:hypothetical protein